MRTVELFAGAGGLAIGAELAGLEHVALIERDRDCVATLRSNQRHRNDFRSADIRSEDVRHVNFAEYEGVDVVLGGPPCQPFSLGGKHRAFLDERDMFPEAIRAIHQIRPKAFIFENVRGLTRAQFASYFGYIVRRLSLPSESGEGFSDWLDHSNHLEGLIQKGLTEYTVSFMVLNAADFGVPQRRERVFLIGLRQDVASNWAFPAATHSQEALRYEQEVTGRYWRSVPDHLLPIDSPQTWSPVLFEASVNQLPWRTLWNAISDLGAPGLNPCYPDHRFQPGAKSYPGHTGSPLHLPSKTIKAGAHGVPGGENMIRFPSQEVRYLTIRESARIQTFPDDYTFTGSWSESMRQIGNAVPVQLAKVLCAHLVKIVEASKHVPVAIQSAR